MKNARALRVFLILAMIALIAGIACILLGRGGNHAGEAVEAVLSNAPGSVTLTENQVLGLGIETAKAAAASALPLPGLAAETQAPLDASTQVVIPYAGVVTRVLVDDGATVARGQPMARIQSRDLLAAQMELANANSEARAAAQQASRDSQLLSEGIIPASRYEQTRLRASLAHDGLRQAQGTMANLRIIGDGQPGEYELLATMSGRVLRRGVAPGQALAAMDSAFVIADSGQIDIIFNVPVRTDDALTIGLPVLLPDGSRAEVAAVGADTDAASQSLRVRAHLAENSRFVAGQQFNVTLMLPVPAGAVTVPDNALLPQGERSVLYVQEGCDYRAVAVERLGGSDALAVVRGKGLQAGADVVTRGTVALKSLVPAE
jgi:RND family efflux transporter MFP subunit